MAELLKAAGLWMWRMATAPLALPAAMVLLVADGGGGLADRFADWVWLVRKNGSG